MHANLIEIDMEADKILAGLPKEVQTALKAEAVRRRIPLRELIAAALVEVSQQITGKAA